MPHSIQADLGVLQHDIAELLETTAVFNDLDLQGANRCLLAAAVGGSLGEIAGTIAHLKDNLNGAPSEAVQAIVKLVHGQEVIISEKSHFFSLFDLVEAVQVRAGQELCKSTVSNGSYQQMPIRLQFSDDQWHVIRKTLQVWQQSKPPVLTDAVIRVKRPCLEEWEAIPVHAVLLAASCEYLRGLWAGCFKEAASGSMCFDVDDMADTSTIHAFIAVIYGRDVKLATTEELINLSVLADRLQSEAVRSKALGKLAEVLTVPEALGLLVRPSPPPEALQQAAAAALMAQVTEDSANQRDVLQGISWTVALRLLEMPTELGILRSIVQMHVAKMMSDKQLAKPGLAEIDPQTLGAILSQCKTSVVDPVIVKCTGRTGGQIKVKHLVGKVTIARLHCGDNEQAQIHIRGPAEIQFTTFQTKPFRAGFGDLLKIRENQYSGSQLPPNFTVSRGQELEMDWSTSRSPWWAHTEDRGWEFEARSLELFTSCDDVAEFANTVLQWAQGYQHPTARTLHSRDSHPDLCSNLLKLQTCVDIEAGDCLRKPFALLITAALKAEGTGLLLKLLSSRHASGKLDSTDLITSSCCSSAAKAMQQVMQNPDWLHIEPAVMKVLLHSVGECNSSGADTQVNEEQFAQELSKWALEGCGFDALGAAVCISHLSNPCSETLFCKAIRHCLTTCGQHAPTTVCCILNEVFGQVLTSDSSSSVLADEHVDGPTAKRRRTAAQWIASEQAQASETPQHCKELLGKAALEWCSELSSQNRFALLGSSASWLELHPAPFLHAVAKTLSNDRQVVSESLVRWVRSASISALCEVLALASAGHSDVFGSVLEAAKDRFVAIEQQNAILEGGKHCKEIAAAVEAAEARTEARLRSEFAASEAAMRSQLIEEQQHKMGELRTRIYALLQADP